MIVSNTILILPHLLPCIAKISIAPIPPAPTSPNVEALLTPISK